MLRNEKYIGDALLQKTFVSDIFTHSSEKNCGQLPQYYVHDCHPAIIDRELFDKVQVEMARRSSVPKRSTHAKTELGKYSGKYALSQLLTCGNCGTLYRRAIWTRPEGKKVVWRCLCRMELGKKACNSPTVEEVVLHQAIADEMKKQTDETALQKALLASAQVADDAVAVQKALLELLKQPMTLEYNDMLVRQVIRKVVVMDGEQFEIKLKGL